MYRYTKKRSPNVQTAKFSRVLWAHCGASVDSSFSFVAIDTRCTEASVNSTFVDDTYFPNSTKPTVNYCRRPENEENFSLKNTWKIYEEFERLKLVCLRNSRKHFYPSTMIMYKNNVVKYNRTTELCFPDLIDNVDKNNASRSKTRPTENISRNPLINQVLPRNKNVPFNQKIAEIREYYRRLKTAKNTPNSSEDPFTITSTDKKYWSLRYKLFEKFNEGILLDRESFYSVCPESLAHHIAKRCKNKVVIDPFCGAGGNVIQLAMTCKRVIAMDIDEHKVQMAKINAKIYGVDHKIEFHVGDFFQLTGSEFQADMVVTSPPWGGPEYSATNAYILKSMCQAHGGGERILEIAKRIAPNVALHLPKTTNVRELITLANDWAKVEIQQNLINEKLNSITAFYGEFENVTNFRWPT